MKLIKIVSLVAVVTSGTAAAVTVTGDAQMQPQEIIESTASDQYLVKKIQRIKHSRGLNTGKGLGGSRTRDKETDKETKDEGTN